MHADANTHQRKRTQQRQCTTALYCVKSKYRQRNGDTDQRPANEAPGLS
jgi:hypothetical protein